MGAALIGQNQGQIQGARACVCSLKWRATGPRKDDRDEWTVTRSGRSRWWVVCGWFPSSNISHEKLVELVELRVADRRVLRLIQKWLKAGGIGRRAVVRNEGRNAAGSGDLAATCEHLPALRVGTNGSWSGARSSLTAM